MDIYIYIDNDPDQPEWLAVAVGLSGIHRRPLRLDPGLVAASAGRGGRQPLKAPAPAARRAAS